MKTSIISVSLKRFVCLIFLMLQFCYLSSDGLAQLCAADAANNPSVDAGKIILSCIEQSQDKAIELLPGRYYLKSAISIRGQSGIVFKTRGVSEVAATCLSVEKGTDCAVFIADDSFHQGPLLDSVNATHLTFDHIGLDGNIDKRRAKLGNDGWEGRVGFNAAIHGCTGCKFIGFASINAARGTGLEFSGDNAEFNHTLFRDNGWGLNKYPPGHAWADGLTVHTSRNLKITNSEFSNNSDVNLIIGGAPNGLIENNLVHSTNNFSFAAIMLDNFNGSTSGDFTGAKIRNNTVDCGQDALCGIGIDLGPKLWYDSVPIYGGAVSNNKITGVRQGIGIYGVKDMKLSQNDIKSAGGFQLRDGRCKTSNIDIGDNHNVTLDAGVATSQHSLHGCHPEMLASLIKSGCDQTTKPFPAWGDKNGQCLKSCGTLGGTRTFTDACSAHGMVSAGVAYDAPYCCRLANP
jgi:hypothetical protein